MAIVFTVTLNEGTVNPEWDEDSPADIRPVFVETRDFDYAPTMAEAMDIRGHWMLNAILFEGGREIADGVILKADQKLITVTVEPL